MLMLYILYLQAVGGRVQSVGENLDGKIHFPLMTKGERFIRCKGKCFEKEHRGIVPRGVMVTRGIMSDMTSLFHKSVFINSKRGYC
jgi:hypothetical protein